MNNFNKQYNKILLDFQKRNKLRQNHGIIYQRQFFETYKHLILEDYNIFPVPEKLLKDMVQFAINNHSYAQKYYSIQDIRDKYSKNWSLYKQFLTNLDLMLQKNLNCSITLVTWKDEQDVQKILEKYSNITKDEILNCQAVIFNYNEKLDLCLAAKVCTNPNDPFKLNMQIQHELIHWMQVTLNSETKKTHGLFDDKPFSLTQQEKQFLYTVVKPSDIDYLAQGVEFDPWVANTVEMFQQMKLKLDYFENVLQNQNEIKLKLQISNFKPEVFDMWLFSYLCYLTSKNDSEDKRYWYLIEAIKSNTIK